MQVQCGALGDPTVSNSDLAVEHLVKDKDNLENKGMSISNGILAYFDNQGLFKMNV